MDNAKYNVQGQLLSATLNGQDVSYEYDDLGRVKKAIQGSQNVAFDYVPAAGLLSVTQTHMPSGHRVTQEYNPLGEVVSRHIYTNGTDGGLNVRSEDFSYDDWSRVTLIDSSDTEGRGIRTQTFGYHGQTSIITNVDDVATGTSLGVVQTLDGESTAVTGVEITRDGKQVTPHYATDILGRVIASEVSGAGPVQLAYDPWGRVTMVTAAADTATSKRGEVLFTRTFGESSVVVDDKLGGVQTTWTLKDTNGHEWSYVQVLEGLDQPRIGDTNLAVSDGTDTQGHQFTYESGFKDFKSQLTVSAAGSVTGQTLAMGNHPLGWKGSAPDVYGTPTQIEDLPTGRKIGLNIHPNGQVTGVRDLLDLETEITSDPLGRAKQLSLPTEQSVQLNYQNQAQLQSISVDDPDAGTTEVFKRNSTWQTESLSWLGMKQTLTGDIQGEKATLATALSDPVSGLGVSDNMVFDVATGRLTSYTDFSGDVYQVNYTNHGRTIEVTHADSGYREVRRYDALGNTISREVTSGSSGANTKRAAWQTRVERDVYGRPKAVSKGAQTTRYDYQHNGFLSKIDQGGQSIQFPKHEPTGAPTVMETSDGSRVDIAYWEDGRSTHLIESYPVNGLPSFYEYDKFGNLISMQEEGRPCISFKYNGYRFPTELSTSGSSFALFDGSSPNILTLPGGVEIEVDGRGQEYRRSFPGLADQIFERDGSGQVRSIQVNGELAVGIDYNGPYPSRRSMMQSETGPQEVVDLTYQDDRLVASDSSLYGLHEFEYSADFPETLTSYARADFEYTYDLRQDGLLDSLSFGSTATDTQTLYYDYDDKQRISQVDFLDFRAKFNDYSDGLPSEIAIRYAGEEREIAIAQEGGFLSGYRDGGLRFELDSVTLEHDQDTGCSKFESVQRVPTRALKMTDRYLEATVTSVRADQTLVDAHIVRAAGDLAELGLGESGGGGQASKRDSSLESVLSDVQSHDETQPLSLGLDIDLDGSEDLRPDLLVRRHAHGRSDLLQTLSQNLAQVPGEDQLLVQLIVERYGDGGNSLVRAKLERHLMVLNLEMVATSWQGTLDYYPLDQLISSADSNAYEGRINQLLWQRNGGASDSALSFSYDTFGNIDGVPDIRSGKETATFDGARRVYQLGTDRANYDAFNRRTDNTDSGVAANLVYAYHDSKPIAIGYREGSSRIQWAYVIVHGPLGPLFLYDMDKSDGVDRSYLVYTDHLGTPWAYRAMADGALFHQSTAPWGDLNHNAETGSLMDGLAAPHAQQVAAGQVPSASKTTAGGALKLFDTPDFGSLHPFLGLSGHIRDRSGLTQMHNRYYSPLLGHFLTPDFRAPDIYDPTTFTEPYAYAAGNPFMYWDPDGLHETAQWDHMKQDPNELAPFGGTEAAYNGLVVTDDQSKAIVQRSARISEKMFIGTLDAVGDMSVDTTVGLGQILLLAGKAQAFDLEAIKSLAKIGWDVATLEVFREQGRGLGTRLAVAEEAAIAGDYYGASTGLSRVGFEISGTLAGAVEGGVLGLSVARKVNVTSLLNGKNLKLNNSFAVVNGALDTSIDISDLVVVNAQYGDKVVNRSAYSLSRNLNEELIFVNEVGMIDSTEVLRIVSHGSGVSLAGNNYLTFAKQLRAYGFKGQRIELIAYNCGNGPFAQGLANKLRVPVKGAFGKVNVLSGGYPGVPQVKIGGFYLEPGLGWQTFQPMGRLKSFWFDFRNSK